MSGCFNPKLSYAVCCALPSFKLNNRRIRSCVLSGAFFIDISNEPDPPVFEIIALRFLKKGKGFVSQIANCPASGCCAEFSRFHWVGEPRFSRTFRQAHEDAACGASKRKTISPRFPLKIRSLLVPSQQFDRHGNDTIVKIVGKVQAEVYVEKFGEEWVIAPLECSSMEGCQ